MTTTLRKDTWRGGWQTGDDAHPVLRTRIVIKLYLAGPDVFARDVPAVAAAKKSICARHGFVGVFPSELAPLDASLPPLEQGLAIHDALEQGMRACDALVADMTPFRGPSMDVGTAFEIAYVRALGRPVFAYSASPEAFESRVAAHFGGRTTRRADGMLEGPDAFAIEEFGMHENLMLDGCVRRSTGVLATGADAFERCIAAAAEWFDRERPAARRAPR